LAIESANAAERLAAHPVIEVVCAGPDSPLAPMRLTSKVELDLVDGATERPAISASPRRRSQSWRLSTPPSREASGWISCWSRRVSTIHQR